MSKQTDEVQAAMNKKDKTLALAKLMDWEFGHSVVGNILLVKINEEYIQVLSPYKDTAVGRAQFAAILLKHPKAIMHYAYDRDKSKWLDAVEGELYKGEPTQASILDVILRMNGVTI